MSAELITKTEALAMLDDADDFENRNEFKKNIMKADVNILVHERDGTSYVKGIEVGESFTDCDVCKERISSEIGDAAEPFVPHYRCATCYSNDEGKAGDLTASKYCGFDVCVSCFGQGKTTSSSVPAHLATHKLTFIDAPEKHISCRDYTIAAIRGAIQVEAEEEVADELAATEADISKS